jgi:hypothetical protein
MSRYPLDSEVPLLLCSSNAKLTMAYEVETSKYREDILDEQETQNTWM